MSTTRRSFLKSLIGAVLAAPAVETFVRKLPVPKLIKDRLYPTFNLKGLPLPIVNTSFVFGMAQLSKSRARRETKMMDEFFLDHPIRFTICDKERPPTHPSVVVFSEPGLGR